MVYEMEIGLTGTKMNEKIRRYLLKWFQKMGDGLDEYGNGVTASEYTYDNTTLDGQVTEWHIDKECWDNKGNPCECYPSWWDNFCEKHK